MKITYKFADGTISEVEVSEELGQAITTSRREEENYERKMRYHCPISIDQLEYQGIEFADPDTPFSLYERKLKEQEQKAINDFVMSHLTETQRRRILKLSEGMSVCETIIEIDKSSSKTYFFLRFIGYFSQKRLEYPIFLYKYETFRFKRLGRRATDSNHCPMGFEC